MINFNPAIGQQTPKPLMPAQTQAQPAGVGAQDFGKLVDKYVASVDQQQQTSSASIADLISGKSGDINAVVAEVAKADMSFKMLVSVRNKIIDAYKQTMQMQI